MKNHIHLQGIIIFLEVIAVFSCDYGEKCSICTCTPSVIFCEGKEQTQIQLYNDVPNVTRMLYRSNSIKYLAVDECYKSLEFLDVSYNKMETLNTDDISSFPHLKQFDASYNKIQTIYTSNSKNLNIKTLLLSHNILTELANFSKMPVLENVDLSYNKIIEFRADTFPKTIRSIDLTYNSIHTLYLDDFAEFTNGILLYGNVDVRLIGNNIVQICFMKNNIEKQNLKNTSSCKWENNCYRCSSSDEFRSTWLDSTTTDLLNADISCHPISITILITITTTLIVTFVYTMFLLYHVRKGYFQNCIRLPDRVPTEEPS